MLHCTYCEEAQLARWKQLSVVTYLAPTCSVQKMDSSFDNRKCYLSFIQAYNMSMGCMFI